jgi:hypothetical protein
MTRDQAFHLLKLAGKHVGKNANHHNAVLVRANEYADFVAQRTTVEDDAPAELFEDDAIFCESVECMGLDAGRLYRDGHEDGFSDGFETGFNTGFENGLAAGLNAIVTRMESRGSRAA